MLERGGVLIRVDESDHEPAGGFLAFISADVVVRVTTLSALTPVVGLNPPAVGIALSDDGEVVTVLRLGGAPPDEVKPDGARGRFGELVVKAADLAVLCRVKDQEVAIVGGTVIATGLFEASDDDEDVFWDGLRVPALDVQALAARAEAASWVHRAAPSAGSAARIQGGAT
jgi:hypothetical protein